MKNYLKIFIGKNKKILNLKNRRGSVIVPVMVYLMLLLTFGMALISIITRNYLSSRQVYQDNLAAQAAEAGAEEAFSRLKKGETITEIALKTLSAQSQFEVIIKNQGNDDKHIEATGYSPSKSSTKKVVKTVRLQITDNTITESPAFRYAVQAGTYGIKLSGNGSVGGATPQDAGNLYSNENIAVNSAAISITGDAYAVGVINDPHNKIPPTKKFPGSPAIPLPYIDLTAWEKACKPDNTHIYNGNWNPAIPLKYPATINGNVSVGDNQEWLISGAVWINGSINITGGTIKMAEIFGTAFTYIFATDTINISGNTSFFRNAAGSYPVFVSTKTASANETETISYSGRGSQEKIGLYAYNGTIKFSGNATVVMLCGKGLDIVGRGTIKYERGLASANFSSGPGSSWRLKGWQFLKNP